MADGIKWDFSEVERVAVDLTEVEHLSIKKVAQAVQQTALRTKNKWQADASSKAGARTSGYPGAISYDEHEFGAFGQGVYQADVGPELGGQGSLGILEETPEGVRGPARHSDRVAEKFSKKELAKGVDIAIDQSLKEAGL